ncbi:hypothetical protein BOX15_Mlig034447g2 [Macrostomum lignano]|uniref:alpha-1,2-Mannosidase n=2 Tax=Macrostomum lignano TaxID=282301 RepID=A0A267H4Q7_9PLAT|nr:hypothetical protein BOX15_Mlig018391g1 [Macrostomum lignano]PAA92519.1 hypothetical protein BOX15_Mlig034447g2 [Macrostomum lignano]
MLFRPLQRIQLRLKLHRTHLFALILTLVVITVYYRTVMLQPGGSRWRYANPLKIFILASSSLDDADQAGMAAVREMAQFAWRGYTNSCLRQHKTGNELAPLTRNCSSNSDGIVGAGNLLTVIDSLDTLAVLGLPAEFDEGRSFIRNFYNPQRTWQEVSVFETTIRLLGGLLGAYSVSEDVLFLKLAAQLGDGLAPAFPRDGGFFPRVKLFSNVTPSSNLIYTAEIGSLYLEFAYLAELTGNEKYFNWVDKLQRELLQIRGLDGILTKQLMLREPATLDVASGPFSIAGGTDSYYEYLVKRCMFDSDVKPDCVDTFTKVLDSIMKHLTVHVSKDDSGGVHTCIGELSHPTDLKLCSMDHLTCFAGGMFALAYLQVPKRVDWLDYAEKITETCYLSYQHSPTKLGPEKFAYDFDSKKFVADIDMYILRPETVESLFYLYRVTGKPKYRQWGWSILKALNTSTRVGSGFSGIESMNSAYMRHDNMQWSFFLAETLKYLYLLFSPTDKLPLDLWLFNTEAHAIPTRLNPLRKKLARRGMRTI